MVLNYIKAIVQQLLRGTKKNRNLSQNWRPDASRIRIRRANHYNETFGELRN